MCIYIYMVLGLLCFPQYLAHIMLTDIHNHILCDFKLTLLKKNENPTCRIGGGGGDDVQLHSEHRET